MTHISQQLLDYPEAYIVRRGPGAEWNEGGCQLLRRPVFRKKMQQSD